ncbi:hypothetical protein ACFV1N_25240 [Streptosporangium canum]|uniref:hypothetical protein n=1 Tax=Streptosporangium canum TaxID=324952 RepID=UPI0036B43FAB
MPQTQHVVHATSACAANSPAAVYTVAAAESAGVLADLYDCGLNRTTVFTGKRNIFVGWDEFATLPYALATQMVVGLQDMAPVDASCLNAPDRDVLLSLS